MHKGCTTLVVERGGQNGLSRYHQKTKYLLWCSLIVLHVFVQYPV